MIKEAQEYKEVLGKILLLDDWEAVDIFLAVVASHKLQGDMFWFRIIGASGSGKSELLSSLQSHSDYCIPADTFTPGAIRGGYKSDKGVLPRMLDQWNGKIVLTKDFASVISKKKEDRAEVFGLMRSAWDGTLDAFYGSEDAHVSLKFHFDWIVATTPYIERQRSLEAELGTRFVDLHWLTPQAEEDAVFKAGSNNNNILILRQELAETMGRFLKAVKITENYIEDRWLARLAALTARYRTPVYRDYYHEVSMLPAPELGTRLYLGMRKVAIGLVSIGIADYNSYMIRLALDSLPRVRKSIITTLLVNPKATQEEMASNALISQQAISRELEDLQLLGFKKERLSIYSPRITPPVSV